MKKFSNFLEIVLDGSFRVVGVYLSFIWFNSGLIKTGDILNALVFFFLAYILGYRIIFSLDNWS